MTSFLLPMPPSVNALYANAGKRGRVKTAAYRTWIDECQWAGGFMKEPPVHVAGQVAVCYRIPWPKDKRRRDIGNLEKPLSDMLVRLGAIEDDSKIVDLHLVYGPANVEGKVLVEIRPA